MRVLSLFLVLTCSLAGCDSPESAVDGGNAEVGDVPDGSTDDSQGGDGGKTDTSVVQLPNWGTPVPVAVDDASPSDSPLLAVDHAGNAAAVWLQRSDDPSGGWTQHVHASRYDVKNDAWGTSNRIQESAASSRNAQVATNAAGNTLAVWTEFDSGIRGRTLALDVAEADWGVAAAPVGGGGEGAQDVRIAMAPNGEGVAVWTQPDRTRSSVYASRYHASSASWGPTELVEQYDDADGWSPQVGVDAAGNAMVVWTQSYNFRDSVYVNRYDSADGGWGTPQRIEVEGIGHSWQPRIAFDDDGNATAVWEQDYGAYEPASDGDGNPPQRDIWTCRYSASAQSWGDAKPIDVDEAWDASSPTVAVSAGGGAVAIWFQSSDGSASIVASRYDRVTGSWEPVVVMDRDGAGFAVGRAPRVAIDGTGNVVTVWARISTESDSIFANLYDVTAQTWGAAQAIHSDVHDVAGIQVAVDGGGAATVVWAQANAPGDVWGRWDIWGTHLLPGDKTN